MLVNLSVSFTNSEIIKSIAGNVKGWAGDWDAVYDNIILRGKIKLEFKSWKLLLIVIFLFELSILLKDHVNYKFLGQLDPYSHLGWIKYILENHRLPRGGPWLYTRSEEEVYPLSFHLLTAGLIESLNLNLMFLCKIVGPIIASLTPISLFFLTMKIAKDEKTAILSSYLLATSPIYITRYRLLLPEAAGIFLLPITLALYLRAIEKKGMYLYFGVIALTLQGLTHLYSFVITELIIAAYLAIRRIRKSPTFKTEAKTFLIIYGIGDILTSPIWMLKLGRILGIINREMFIVTAPTTQLTLKYHIFTSYYGLAGYALIGISTLAGLLYAAHEEGKETDLALSLVVTPFVMSILPARSIGVSTRPLPFLVMGLATISALGLLKIIIPALKERYKGGKMETVMTHTLIAFIMTIQFIFAGPIYDIGIETLTDHEYAALLWIKYETPKDAVIVCHWMDQAIIYDFTGRKTIISEEEPTPLNRRVISISLLTSSDKEAADILKKFNAPVYVYINEWCKYYSPRYDNNIYPKNSLQKFQNSTLFQPIYKSKTIEIYELKNKP